MSEQNGDGKKLESFERMGGKFGEVFLREAWQFVGRNLLKKFRGKAGGVCIVLG